VFTSTQGQKQPCEITLGQVEIYSNKSLMAKARIDYCKGQLFSLPTDLLPLIFSFLSPKELCCLDSAILNHTDRPLFVSALIQRFTKESIFHFRKCYKLLTITSIISNIQDKEREEPSMDSYASWYRCRRIPVTTLTLFNTSCPPEMISMNINYLTNIKFVNICLGNEDVVALGRCLNLKTLSLCDVSTDDGESSIFQNLSSSLEYLKLSDFILFRAEVEAISRSFPSLKSLELSSMEGVGDEELCILVEGFPNLRTLRLSYLIDITDDSVRMLRSHRPRIPLIAIRDCDEVSVASTLSLFREFTISTILSNDGDEDFQLSALENIKFSILDRCMDDGIPEINDLLSQNSLLERLVDLFIARRLRSIILELLSELVCHGPDQLVDAGVVPVLIRHFDSFDQRQISNAVLILYVVSKKTSYHELLLSSGVLSVLRPRRIHFVTIPSPSSLPPLISFLESCCFSSFRISPRLPVSSYLSIVGSD
jgi:hypothetical protein